MANIAGERGGETLRPRIDANTQVGIKNLVPRRSISEILAQQPINSRLIIPGSTQSIKPY